MKLNRMKGSKKGIAGGKGNTSHGAQAGTWRTGTGGMVSNKVAGRKGFFAVNKPARSGHTRDV